MYGIIDKDSNPFGKDYWMEQGYSFNPDRQEFSQRLFKDLTHTLIVQLIAAKVGHVKWLPQLL